MLFSHGLLSSASSSDEDEDEDEASALKEEPPAGSISSNHATRKRTWLDRALGWSPPEEEEEEEAESTDQQGDSAPAPAGPPEPAVQPDEEDESAIFQPTQESRASLPVPRITMAQAIKYTARNSYEVYLGRSLTRPQFPAVKIRFFKRHIKIIGASQYGKSSMAAFILEAIIRTHDPERVMIALLDMEHKTSRLFAEVPHLATLEGLDGTPLPLYGRDPYEVLLHLRRILALIKYRYTLTEQELDARPLLVVYLEEFIDLKDFFKNRLRTASTEAERVQAQRDYDSLVYCIKHIARRGLKARVQLLLCAQVDYRDDDLQEALVNVTSGMALCLRPSVAQAAGFYRTDLIKRNAQDNQVGTAVVEMPEHKDLVLAPEYDLQAKLRRLVPPLPPLPQRERPIYRNEPDGNAEMPIYGGVKGSVNGAASGLMASEHMAHLHLLGDDDAEHKTPESPPGNVNVNETIRETVKRLAEQGVKHNVIAKAVRLDGRNYPIYKQLCKELGITMEKEA